MIKFPNTVLPSTAHLQGSSAQGSPPAQKENDWGDFLNGGMRIAQGPGETLAHALTDRALTIRRFENGVVELDLKRPDIKTLVLSGGGAKGVAFAGMVKALEASQALGKIESISGSSAGAISAAFLASGMRHADFDQMSDETNLVSLLDSQNIMLEQLQHASSTIGKGVAKIPGKVGTIGQLLFDLVPRLHSRAAPLEALIREKMVESIQSRFNDALNDPQRQISPASKACVKQISANGYVTFGDLATLSKELPEIKQLHITGTAMFDGRPQMVVFNASLTPDMDVARAAHISGSLPFVFQQPSEQQLPFQAEGERTRFQDGGIMLNTPVLDLYEPQFRMSAIPDSEQLILKFESENGGEKNDRGTLLSAMTDSVIRVQYRARDVQEAHGIQIFADETVPVPLRTERGDFTGTFKGTVNFSMPLADKNHLQEKLQKKVEEHLSRHESSKTYTFASIGGALLALDDTLFEATAHELQNDQQSLTVITFRQEAQQALNALKHALMEAKTKAKDTLVLTSAMRNALATLDQLGDAPGKIDWLAKKLNHGNDPDYMELLQAVKRMDAGAHGPKSAVMTEAIKEMGLRDIVTKSENFIREVIYPSLYRPRQPDANVRLLNQSIVDLRTAKSDEEYNAVLNRMIERYVSRTALTSSRPSRSTTIEQARAWLIPGG